MSNLAQLRREAGVNALLSAIDSNPKVKKNSKVGVLGAVLHLAPGNMSGHEVCPKRSPGCTAACLHFAGSPLYQTNKTKSRIAKTQLLFRDRNLFMNILALEIQSHIKKADRMGLKPSIRLNGTSDIVWEKKAFFLSIAVSKRLGVAPGRYSIINLFPTVQFYDYTAIPGRIGGDNYHLTFSLKEHNENEVKDEVKRGLNIAVVFDDNLPSEHLGMPVIDGDEHDFRPSDPRGVVVGLSAKGARGKADSSGFVNRRYSLAA